MLTGARHHDIGDESAMVFYICHDDDDDDDDDESLGVLSQLLFVLLSKLFSKLHVFLG